MDMHRTWEALADDTRRSIVEVLADGERTAGELAAMFSISRPGVSRHLRVLRDAGLVRAAPQAQRRIYRLDPQGLAQIDGWLDQFRRFWSQRLDALETEVARGAPSVSTSTTRIRMSAPSARYAAATRPIGSRSPGTSATRARPS